MMPKIARLVIDLLLELFAEVECRLGLSEIGGQRHFWRKRQLRRLGVDIKGKINVGRSFYLRNRGNLELGENCGIGSFAKIWNYAPITIGSDFLAGGGLTMNSATHDPATLNPEGRPIKIGNRVWCGINVTILAGVTIGDDVVIGAGSVVTSDIPSLCVAAGVPAKKIRDLARDENTELWKW